MLALLRAVLITTHGGTGRGGYGVTYLKNQNLIGYEPLF